MSITTAPATPPAIPPISAVLKPFSVLSGPVVVFTLDDEVKRFEEMMDVGLTLLMYLVD